MILRRSSTRRVPSGRPAPGRAPSRPARPARPASGSRRCASARARSAAGRTRTPRPGAARAAARSVRCLAELTRHLLRSAETSSSACTISAGSSHSSTRQRLAQLGGGAGADDRRGDPGAVAHPGQRHLERGPAEAVGGARHRLDHALGVLVEVAARRRWRSAARRRASRPGCRRGTCRSARRGPAATTAGCRGRAPARPGRPRPRRPG